METKKDILDLEDITRLVDTFYEKVRRDPLLGPIFQERIGETWKAHLEKMYRFWQTLLLEEHTYTGSPFPHHIYLKIGDIHFEAWMKLFSTTVDELFTGDKASEAKWRAAKMAEIFAIKLKHLPHHLHG